MSGVDLFSRTMGDEKFVKNHRNFRYSRNQATVATKVVFIKQCSWFATFAMFYQGVRSSKEERDRRKVLVQKEASSSGVGRLAVEKTGHGGGIEEDIRGPGGPERGGLNVHQEGQYHCRHNRTLLH